MKKLFLTLTLILACGATAMAQGLKDVKINEILVNNVDNYADNYGHKNGWIELFNSGYSNVSLAGAHLKVIKGSDTTIYRIPKNDTRASMVPQGYIIFFAEGTATKGTFHTNFTLEADPRQSAQTYYLELLDQSGKVVMDVMEYNINEQVIDKTYGRLQNHETGEWSNTILPVSTPMQTNDTFEATPKSELFRQEDPNGTAMAVTAMAVVFSALLVLFLVFNFIGKAYKSKSAKTAKAVVKAGNKPMPEKPGQASGEVISAIAIALQMYQDDMHDIESTVMTINKVARTYSPWSSKIYSMNVMPHRPSNKR